MSGTVSLPEGVSFAFLGRLIKLNEIQRRALPVIPFIP